MQVTAKGKYAGIVSTVVETNNPAAEVQAGVAILGELITKFDNICDTFVPVEDGSKSKVFITASYDASSHFESTTNEVMALYKRITGEDVDLTAPAEVSTQ